MIQQQSRGRPHRTAEWVRRLLVCAALAASITCSSPTDSPVPPTDDPPSNPPTGSGPVETASLDLTGPSAMIVHESSLLAVTARDVHGQVIAPSRPFAFASSDAAVVTVSDAGVISAVGRGTAIVSVRQDTALARLTVVVSGRPVLVRAPGQEWREHVPVSTGDTLWFAAQLVDVDGIAIGTIAATDWRSSDPSVVSVSSDGVAIALQPGQSATLTASTADGQAAESVEVSTTVVGLPATVRFVHAVKGAGPITLRPNRLPAVTLSYGQSVDLATTSGTFYVDGGSPPPGGQGGFYGLIEPGAALSLYLVGTPSSNFLTAAWGGTEPIPPTSGLVRLIQSSVFPVVFLRNTGAPKSGLPEECYLDPGTPSVYYPRAAGAFDLLLQVKPRYVFDPTDEAYTRVPASVPAGHAVTLVLTGDSPATADYLAFTDR